MWEFMISVSAENRDVAEYIYGKLKNFSNDYKNIVTSYESNQNINIVLSCNDFERFRFKMTIEEVIAESICSIIKKKFLLNNIDMIIKDEIAKDAFLQALLLFDRETDRYLVGKYLTLSNKLHLDGFFNFKLKALREKWQELINIANDNQLYLCSNETFIELIKFLVDNIEIRNDVINIVENGDNITITNAEFLTINENCYTEKLVSSLIELCPKCINIYCSDKIPNNVTKLICQLFEKRVKFLKRQIE